MLVQIPTASKLYFRCFKVQEALKDLVVVGVLDDYIVSQAQHIFLNRWNMLHTPLVAAAYALDPEHLCVDMFEIAEAMQGLVCMVDRLSPCSEPAGRAMMQFRNFRRCDTLKTGAHLTTARSMPPWQWWHTCGFQFPDLKPVAGKVLAQVVSATECERNWSVFGYLHTASRNRMSVEKAGDHYLVDCHSLHSSNGTTHFGNHAS
jgi:hypothetical protein